VKNFVKNSCLVILAVILLLSVLTGCQKQEVKIVGYLLGAAPPGMPEVMVKLNEMLKKQINATMEIRYIGWGDFQAKYPLVLAAGEDIDWIYTSNWSFYFQEAAKGAFLEITKEMLEKNMPLQLAALPPAAYKQVNVNGKMYMIPGSTPDRKIPVALIRGDLRKKYGIPEITKFSDIEPYLAAIKANEPGMVPLNMDSTYDVGLPAAALGSEMGVTFTDVLYATGAGSGLNWNLEENTGKLYFVTDEPLYTQTKKAATIMKSWYDKGYINRNVLNNKVRSKDAFNQGLSAVGIGNSQDVQSNLADATAKGWDVEIIPLLDAARHYPADPFINNGVALAATTKKAAKTMQALDLIMQDKTFNYVAYFGIEGKNYIVKDNKIALPEGLKADQNTYPSDAAGFWFTNKDQFLPLASWDTKYIALKATLKDYLIQHPMTTFAAKTDNVKTEITNLNQVLVQYSQPISVGMVENVEAALKTLAEKLTAAGVEKVRTEMQAQVDAHVKSLQ